MGFIRDLIDVSNTVLWSYLLIYMLIGLGLYFTIRTGFVQFRYFGEMFRLLGDRNGLSKRDKKRNFIFTSFFY